MKRALLLVAIALMAIGGTVVHMRHTVPNDPRVGVGYLTKPIVTIIQPVCQEDDPCWDCSTMGNGICRTTTTVP